MDLDHYLANHLPLDALKRSGSYVMKSHYPNFNYTTEATAALKDLIKNSFVIRPVRKLDDIRRPQAAWGMTDPVEFDRTVAAYEQFWQAVPTLDVLLDNLADPKKAPKPSSASATTLASVQSGRPFFPD